MAKLTENQIRFCEEYVLNGFNGTKGYVVAFGQENTNAAAVGACQLLRDSRILDKIKEVEGDYRVVGHKIGVNKELIVNRLKDLLYAKKQVFYNGEHIGDADDNAAINKAIETFLKLTGDFAPEKKQIVIDDGAEVDVTKLTEEERKLLKEKILREL
jgi:phage terminase small subunit